MEAKSPPSCPKTVTVRRNPHRRARDTPLTNVPVPFPKPTSKNDISSFPIEEILSIEVKANPEAEPVSAEEPVSDSLKVYLRIRPVVVQSYAAKKAKIGAENLQVKNAWPRNPRAKSAVEKKVKKSSETCITVNDSHSITLQPPAKLQNSRRIKSEVYEGFSDVFSPEASQKEVYEKMVNPLVNDFIRGRSTMLAALGPSGSGKTHTIFGSGKDPGMVTLALRKLFSEEDAAKTESSRYFYLSMFEICTEKGKSEKIFDLAQDRTDLCSQQTSIKGLQETRIYDIQQAESIIASGLLRRSTATTNSNSQSSRSQCIINIRCGHKKIDEEVGESSNSSVLTIVDLAGAEREKKTGNQGARLLESNFINNTSMVFGQCLRSLLEHQKNPKKPMQKHFQNSMLTRYLRDYLEGKKRMALLLTARPEGEDYLDNSFLLRQASPYTKIKFDCIEEPINLNCNKRPSQTMPMSEQLKRMKIGDIEACSSGGIKTEKGSSLLKEELTAGGVDDVKKRDREYQVLQGFSKGLWNVLKEYKKKLEVAENEIHCLREELKDFKSQHSSQIMLSAKVPSTEDHQSTETEEVNSELSSCQLTSSNQTGSKELCDHIVTSSRSCTGEALYEENCCQDYNEKFVLKKSFEDTAGVEDLKLQDVDAEYTYSNCETPGILMDSCLCQYLDDEKSEERTDSTPVKSTTESCLLPNYGKSQLQNEVVKDGENETCTLLEEFKDLKSEHFSQIIASSEVSSTEDHCSVDLEEQYRKSPEDPNLEDVEVEDTPLEWKAPTISANSSQCSDQEDENTKESSDSTIVEVEANSALPPNVIGFQPQCEEEKKHLQAPMPESEDVGTCNRRCDDSNATEAVLKHTSYNNSRQAEKPKRRLLPASSILLKDINNIDFVDENEKAKGTRGEKKAAAVNVKNRSEGNLSLLRLLMNQPR
ncbi:kinesin-like protein KIN-6 isoform X2 [Ipomoea triloba]|uniref:kinesin-like protein KIN-6 isoform X2 n=1 Tax=Ipomoea triloba TaxID=35885 RepID=UPI00125E3EB5|nr:kinesin-like protein KIN-6 isoform X2 [Ipomoea triloba]